MSPIQTNNICSSNISPIPIDHQPCVNSLKHTIVQAPNFVALLCVVSDPNNPSDCDYDPNDNFPLNDDYKQSFEPLSKLIFISEHEFDSDSEIQSELDSASESEYEGHHHENKTIKFQDNIPK